MLPPEKKKCRNVKLDSQNKFFYRHSCYSCIFHIVLFQRVKTKKKSQKAKGNGIENLLKLSLRLPSKLLVTIVVKIYQEFLSYIYKIRSWKQCFTDNNWHQMFVIFFVNMARLELLYLGRELSSSSAQFQRGIRIS